MEIGARPRATLASIPPQSGRQVIVSDNSSKPSLRRPTLAASINGKSGHQAIQQIEEFPGCSEWAVDTPNLNPSMVGRMEGKRQSFPIVNYETLSRPFLPVREVDTFEDLHRRRRCNYSVHLSTSPDDYFPLIRFSSSRIPPSTAAASQSIWLSSRSSRVASPRAQIVFSTAS